MFSSPSAAWLFRIIIFSSAARPTSFLTSFLLCLDFIQHAHSLRDETWFFHTLRLDSSTLLLFFDVSNVPGTFHCETSAAFSFIFASDSIFQHWTQNYPLVFQLFHHTQSNLDTRLDFFALWALFCVCWTLGRNRENSLTFPIELNYLQCETQRAFAQHSFSFFLFVFFDRHFFDLFPLFFLPIALFVCTRQWLWLISHRDPAVQCETA